MHGGAAGSGAPSGNQNALKTGLHTSVMLDLKRTLSAFDKETDRLISAAKKD